MDRLLFLPQVQQHLRLFPRRPEPRELGHRAERAGLRHVRLAAARASRRGLLVGALRRVDRHRPRARHLFQLEARRRAPAQVHLRRRRLDHHPAVSAKPLLQQVHRDPQRLRGDHLRLFPRLHRLRLQHRREALPVCLPLRLRRGADRRRGHHHLLHLPRRPFWPPAGPTSSRGC